MSNTATVGTKTMLAGTLGFQSPEQLKAESIGPPSDIYAFSGVLAVLFGEQPLWQGLNAYQIMYKVTMANEKAPVKLIKPPEMQEECRVCLTLLLCGPLLTEFLGNCYRYFITEFKNKEQSQLITLTEAHLTRSLTTIRCN